MFLKVFSSALLLLTIQSSAAQSKEVSPIEYVSRIKAKISFDCEIQKLALETDSSHKSRAVIQPSVDMLCTCLPGEIEALEAKVTANNMSLEAAQEGTKHVLQHCSAKGVRKSTFDMCMADSTKDVKEERQESFCDCLRTGVNRLSDQEIAQSALISNANFLARVAALKAGRANPAPHPSAMDNVTLQCKKQHRN